MLNRRRVVLSTLLAVVLLLVCYRRIGREAEPPVSVTFMAVGDVLLDRGIARKIDANGQDWPFAKVSPILKSADIAFCNLECPLSARGVKVNKPFCFKADPANVKCLADAGFDVVSLANNHSLDCGRTGLVETMRCLDDLGIRFVGAGDTLNDSKLPVVMELHGLRIAFLARNTLMPEGIWLRTDAPGTAGLDESTICREIAQARTKADVVIVSLHWGIEYRQQSEEAQKVLARKMIDAGADLVIGHHPHVVQPIERYHGGMIAYSLGNFLFDSPQPICKKSIIFKCRLSKSGVSDVEVIPATISGYRPIPGGNR